MIKPKISIVVPVFNAEKYLRQCLDSIVNQTLRDIEIICVNDGSTDNSLSILKEYALADERVRIIDKENGGYGHSMNKGFAVAQGEYLGIVESDDYADLDMYQRLYDCAKKHNLDVVKAGFYYYYSVGEERNIPNPIASRVASSRTFCPVNGFKSIMEMVDFFNIKPTIWSAIYRREFIVENNIRFNETPGASYQDASFNFKVWACAQRVRLMQECFLHYRQDNEASSINSPGKIYCICDEYDEMQRFLDSHPWQQGILEPVMVRIKYDSYMWNYARLAEPLQAEFVLRFSDDFKKHETDGILQRKFFEQYKWDNLRKIIEDPNRYHEYQIITRDGGEVPQWNPSTKESALQYVHRKLLGGYYCLREHGFMYTWNHFLEKVCRRLVK